MGNPNKDALDAQELKLYIDAITVSLARVLPGPVLDVFIDGLRTCARERMDAGHTRLGRRLQELPDLLDAVRPPASR